MKVKVWHKISYISEAIALLERCAGNEDGISKQRREMLSDQVIRRIEVSERIVKAGEAMLASEMEKIKFYFKTLPNLSFTLADALLLMRYKMGTGEPEDMGSAVAKWDGQEKLRRLIGLSMMDDAEHCFDNVQAWIEQLDTDDAAKWRFLSAYRNREKQLLDVIPLLEAAQKVITQTKDIWAPAVDEFVRFWENVVKTRDVGEDLKAYSGVNVEAVVKGGELVFCPSIIRYNSLSFHILDDSPESFCSIGIMFGEDFYFDRSKEKKEDDDSLPEILKLLGDKSKFKILKAVKDEGAYGARLAKQLGLTTATISHHVNALVQKRLVLIEPEDNKVYFKLNQEKIREVVSALQDEFL